MFFAPSSRKKFFWEKFFSMLKPKLKSCEIAPPAGRRPAEVKVKMSKNQKTYRLSDFPIFLSS